MDKIKYYAETNKGEIKQFFTFTFMLDNTLYAWTNQKTIEETAIHNIYPEDKPSSNLYIRTKENWFGYQPNGYTTTGSHKPTEFDIPLNSIRSIWIER